MLEQRDTAAAGVLEGVTEGHQSAASIKFHAQALQVWSCAENARYLLVGACTERVSQCHACRVIGTHARSLVGAVQVPQSRAAACRLDARFRLRG